MSIFYQGRRQSRHEKRRRRSGRTVVTIAGGLVIASALIWTAGCHLFSDGAGADPSISSSASASHGEPAETTGPQEGTPAITGGQTGGETDQTGNADTENPPEVPQAEPYDFSQPAP